VARDLAAELLDRLHGGRLVGPRLFALVGHLGHKPDAHRSVLTGGGDALAVGEERHAQDGFGVAFVFVHLLAALRVPDAHDAGPAGDDALAVGRERGATGSAAFVERLLVGQDLLQLLAGLHVPDVDGAFGTRRQQARAVRREAHFVEIVAVPGPLADLLAGFEVPQADPGPSVRRREPGLGTVGEGDRVAVNAEDGGLLAGVQIPQTHRPILRTAAGDCLALRTERDA